MHERAGGSRALWPSESCAEQEDRSFCLGTLPSPPLSHSFITAVDISSCARARRLCARSVEEPEGAQVPAEMRALLVPEPRSARLEMFSARANQQQPLTMQAY